jgi:hypothetical protein
MKPQVQGTRKATHKVLNICFAGRRFARDRLAALGVALNGDHLRAHH